jgi:long-chain acyl-CoA synthetase
MKTINQFFEFYAEKYSQNVMMHEKSGNTWIASTYAEIHKHVQHMAAGLMSLGLKKGDRVFLVSEGRNAWVISELGILYCGAINVPLSVKLQEGSDLKFRINHSGSKMVIISGGQSRKLENIKNELDTVEKFIYLDPRSEYG